MERIIVTFLSVYLMMMEHPELFVFFFSIWWIFHHYEEYKACTKWLENIVALCMITCLVLITVSSAIIIIREQMDPERVLTSVMNALEQLQQEQLTWKNRQLELNEVVVVCQRQESPF